MKLKFKIQSYQTNAVKSVVDCFEGQVSYDTQYRINPGVSKKPLSRVSEPHSLGMQLTGFKNADIQLNDRQLIESIKAVQHPARPGESLHAQVERIEQIRFKQQELKKFKARLQKEKQYNQKITINTELCGLDQELEKFIQPLLQVSQEPQHRGRSI